MDHNNNNVPVAMLKQYIDIQNNIASHKAQIKTLQQNSSELSKHIILYMNTSKLEQINTTQNIIQVKEVHKAIGVNRQVLEAVANELRIPPDTLFETIKKHQKLIASNQSTSQSLALKAKK